MKKKIRINNPAITDFTDLVMFAKIDVISLTDDVTGECIVIPKLEDKIKFGTRFNEYCTSRDISYDEDMKPSQFLREHNLKEDFCEYSNEMFSRYLKKWLDDNEVELVF